MKYLILFLISFNTFAMWKFTVTNPSGRVFICKKSKPECLQWYTDHKNNGTIKTEHNKVEIDISAQVALDAQERAGRQAERDSLRAKLKNLGVLLDKKPGETIQEYRTRKALLLQRVIKRIFKDVNGE